MSLFDPDPAALLTGLPSVRFLSQRDLSLQVPINFVTQPGVSLTPACFANRTYDQPAAARCFSNLLVSQFRRIEIDLFWDVTRQVWGLCPVQLGDADLLSPNTTSSEPSLPTTQPMSASLRSDQLTGRDGVAITTVGVMNAARQQSVSGSRPTTAESPSSGSSSAAPISLESPSTAAMLTGLSSGSTQLPNATSVAIPAPTALNSTLLRIGPYTCSGQVNFDLFTQVLQGYLDDTETNLNATIKYLILNLHAAAPASDPTGSAQQPTANNLPHDATLLSAIINQTLSVYLYSPNELAAQRADLNASGSWFGVPPNDVPNSAYFQLNNSTSQYSTPDGWPSESFVELLRAKRLLAGFGQIDPQMSGYNFPADASSIFAQGYLDAERTVEFNGEGQLSTGCFYRAGLTPLVAVNSSWATVTFDDATSPPPTLFDEVGNLTACGISPTLNQTIADTTANENYLPYQNFAFSTIWSWGDGQPLSPTGPNQNSQCATLNATSGRWQASDCSENHHGACRVSDLPYEWQIGNGPASYMSVNGACAANTSFDVPRTALQNTYLIAAWRQALAAQRLNDDAAAGVDDLLWLNFNDLDQADCWVVGQNSTCSYVASTTGADRTVVVPVVAGVIVFVLAALTVFVKCAANRQNTRRRRRRVDDKWDYEGVPS